MTFSPKTSPEKRQEAVGQLIRELSADTKPILLGPWRSELGFESLYWLPFLKFLANKVPGFDQRAVIVTRGGLAPLYSAVAANGYDLYALRSVTEVRRENMYDHQNRGLQKQLSPTPWDGMVMTDAAKALGVGALYHEIHPAWMYWALGPFWDDLRGVRYLAAMTDYAPLPRVTLDGTPLPPRYVAVKFYARATFPYPHPEIAEFVQRTVGILAAQVPVVVLSSQPGYDDHADIPVAGQNVLQLPLDVEPERNLLAQAAVLGQATAFVGTYGGTAQLALRLGIPSVSFWAEFGGTASAHLSLSRHLSNLTKVPFLTSSIGESLLWQQVTSAVRRHDTSANVQREASKAQEGVSGAVPRVHGDDAQGPLVSAANGIAEPEMVGA